MSSAPGRAWRVHARTHAGIIIDARDYYCAFYELAKKARRSILLLGWQFDSDVPLVRGKDVPPGVDPEDVELLPFLDGLCAKNPALEVRILAWDHSLWLALEREALQKLSFDLRTSKNFYFENDATVSQYGAHHQKVAIIDGRIAFLGSADICQDRWDTSEHACGDELRVGRGGKPCKPYHEVQAVVTGDAARSLVDLFVDRWADGTGQRLDAASLVADGPEEPDPLPRQVSLTMPLADVSLHRQFPHRLGRLPVREVRDLLVSWIGEAERLIYVETQ
jgi:phosphatidylserine/phosphatidylglycerophosphate/cardiolipin synthase-like enzyme